MGKTKTNFRFEMRTLNRMFRSGSGAFTRSAILLVTLVVVLLALTSCGGGAAASDPPSSGNLSGNWQFQMVSPADGSFLGVYSPSCSPAPPQQVGSPPPTPPLCMSGFLVQSSGAVTGQLAYSIVVPATGTGGTATTCSGSAPLTGTVSGQTVKLTATASAQTFTLNGNQSSDGKTLTGTYSTSGGQGCGTAETGLQWSASAVPSVNSSMLGSLHSRSAGSGENFSGEDFSVAAVLNQGPNTGAASAALTGTLTVSGYPCAAEISVTGQISGTSATLQLFAQNGLNIGTIAAIVSSSQGGSNLLHTPPPVAGYSPPLPPLLGYSINGSKCATGDTGYLCLASVATLPVNNQGPVTTACTEPILITPGSIAFPLQALGTSGTQSVTVTNVDTSAQTLNGVSLAFGNFNDDFNSQPTFSEQDNCTPGSSSSLGSSFSLTPQQSCTITLSYTPQESCPWGATPSQCPPFLVTSSSVGNQTAPLTLQSPVSLDNNENDSFAVPVSGMGMSALQASTPELDFGAQALGETSPSQTVFFTNQGSSSVQILSPISGSYCVSNIARPLTAGSAPGLQVVQNPALSGGSSTGSGITVACDDDISSGLPNFPLANDTCSGAVLSPLQSCSVSVSYQPQPQEPSEALDYFLEIDTLQCTGSSTNNGVTTLTPSGCEVDAGRLPVELKSRPVSPLRMSPAAGLNFGIVQRNPPLPPPPLTITLYNDPNNPDINHPNPQTVTFTGNTVPTNSDFVETGNCAGSLAPGNSCTISVSFNPKSVGFEHGSFQIGYTVGGAAQPAQTISLEGTGQ